IGGGISPVAPGGRPGVTVYVMVDDLQTYLERAQQLGGKTVTPPSPIPGIGEFAMFADPDGNVIGLFKAK
ncbi:MAG TPA: VOC family protein, partial [candidate division Zixibacteria bacterium]|nr:VOC family protein [candidate division Zixibacteria bacterium]